MFRTVRLASLIEKSHIKYRDFNSDRELKTFGVSNTEGITRTTHRRSDDLDDYLVIQPGSIAYNPYRVNVGSIGLTPDGVYGLVSPAYVVFRAKKRELVPEVLLDFLKSSEGLRQINNLARGTVRKALRFDDLCKIDIPIIPYDQQLNILERKQNFNQQHRRLLSEITCQETLLEKLKLAILQDAIQGKLTAAWRKENPEVEPASQLLERFRKEKQRLIAEKKLRKEKLLLEIVQDETPFEIPRGWIWCRITDLGIVISGLTKNAAKRGDHKLIMPYLRVANVYANRLDLTDVREIGVTDSEVEKLLLKENDLLVVEGNGSRDQVGRIARWDGSVDPCLHQNHVIKVRLQEPKIAQWVLYWLLSQSGRQIIEKQARTSTGLYNLSTGKVANLPIPLPPLIEQTLILKRVDMLIVLCGMLEAEIKQSRSQAENLLRAVLKEAFTPA